MFLNVDNLGAERMSSSRLFQTTGPATQNARLPSCSLVLGTTKSPHPLPFSMPPGTYELSKKYVTVRLFLTHLKCSQPIHPACQDQPKTTHTHHQQTQHYTETLHIRKANQSVEFDAAPPDFETNCVHVQKHCPGSKPPH